VLLDWATPARTCGSGALSSWADGGEKGLFPLEKALS